MCQRWRLLMIHIPTCAQAFRIAEAAVCTRRASRNAAEKAFYKRSTLLYNLGLQAVTTHLVTVITRSMLEALLMLVAPESSSPVSTCVHASLCIEQSTRARSGECSDVGRARSRGRVPSCQRHLSYPQAQREKAPVRHLQLQGDGSTMAPQCNAAESTETRRLPPLRR